MLDDSHIQATVSLDKDGKQFVGLQEFVEPDQPLGQFHDIRRPENPPHVITSPRAGIIIVQRPLPMTGMGDCLFVIAGEQQE